MALSLKDVIFATECRGHTAIMQVESTMEISKHAGRGKNCLRSI